MSDLIVIGGGPAGMAAAVAAADAGKSVTLIEGRSELGGQYWRSQSGEPISGRDGERGEALRQRVLSHSKITLLLATTVWNVSARQKTIVVRVSDGSRETELVTERLVVATGAHDRVLPFPGWTTPGVMTAGGLQALLKGQGVLAGQSVLLIGTGPFLLTVAAGLLGAKADVTLVEANSLLRWIRHPWVLLTNPSKIKDALYYQNKLRRAKKIRGTVRSIQPGLRIAINNRDLTADAVGVGYGFTPDLSVLLSLGAQTRVEDGNLVADIDQFQQTSIAGVYAAGEVTGIGGVEASLVEGRIAGLAAAGATVPARLMRARKHWRRFGKALADVYRLPRWVENLTPETVICRCEEVTVAKIDATLTELQASDPRSVKLFARTGMGLCQGRFCSQAVAAVVADRGGQHDILSQRPIVSPVPLGLISQDQRPLPRE